MYRISLLFRLWCKSEFFFFSYFENFVCYCSFYSSFRPVSVTSYWYIKGCIHCHSGLGSFHILIHQGLHSLPFWTWLIPLLDPSRVAFTAILELAHSTSWSIKGYIHCHSGLGSFDILIHQGLHSLPFWTWLIPHLDPSRVTFTAILDLAHSPSWSIKGYIDCHSGLGSFPILIHSLPFWT
jgi:hypothetical protein